MESIHLIFDGITPRKSLLVLHGPEEAAAEIHLEGTLVLCVTEPLKVESVRLSFTGERWASWGNDSTQRRKENLIYRKDWHFIPSRPLRTETLPPGNYEWSFIHVISGHMPESVEGRSDNYLIYRLKATIGRGFLSPKIEDRKHIRIIRTLDPAADQLCHEKADYGNWKDKINYRIWIPTHGVVFGTIVTVVFRITPLIKGIRIGEIHLSLWEHEWVRIGRGTQVRARCYCPVKEVYTFPQGQATEVVNGLDCWYFARSLDLPTALRDCRQSVRVKDIHIVHDVEYTVRFVNSDGHTSDLIGYIPLFLYISRFLPFNENNEMTSPASGAIDPLAFAIGPAPTYENQERQHDLLFDGIESDGYFTPAGGLSGANTPFYSQSRRGSADNLASDGTNLENTSVGQDAPAATTSSEDSQVRQDGVPDIQAIIARYGTGYFVPRVQHYEYSQEELARIPSYRTAVRSDRLTPTNELAPRYHPTDPGSWS
ncbi:MAG: hypothetical protein Q9228_003687 [Teloschistes exilis]